MKRLFKIFFGFLLCAFVSGAAHAQGKANLIVSGRDRGSVPAIDVNGVTYVDLQKTARKLGAGIELFSQSKQAKVTAKGFYAILTVPLSEIIVNARPESLSAPVVVNGAAIMAPAEFFLLPSFQNAVQKTVSFKDGTFFVERRFDLARTENKLNSKETLVLFDAKKPLTWKTEQPNKHTVKITFPEATVKRDEHFRLKTDFIASVDSRQTREGAVIKVILGKNARDWSFAKQNGRLVFRAAAAKAAPVPETPEPAAGEPAADKTPAADLPAFVKGPSSVSAKPSVLTEDDGFEEMFQSAPPASPVIAAAEPDNRPPVSKPAPVMKQEPNSLAVSSAHKKMRIMVDPGHGGKDPGAVRGRYREKDWNLSVAKELVRLLKKGGFEVKMTREDDTFVTLAGRSKEANSFKADLFVSIHTNASKNKNAHGFQVYFRSEKATDKEAAEVAALENEAMQYEEVHYNFVDALLQSLAKNEYINESSKVAGYIRNAVYKQPGIGIAVNQNSSVRQANFYVLKGVNSPAVLVEMGYISSQKDRARLSAGSSRGKMALGIYNGIRNYAKQEGWIN